MPTITFVNADGIEVTREVQRNVTFYDGVGEDRDVFVQPAAVTRVEWDHEGGMSSTTTVCGETESRRDSDEGPKLVIEGVVGTDLDDDQVDLLKRLNEPDPLFVVTDIERGVYEVKRVTIEQNNEIKRISLRGQDSLAAEFQVQLRYPGDETQT